MKKQFFLILCLALQTAVQAQFQPQAPLSGHHAIHKDDTLIKAWASGAVFEPGWIQLTDTSLGKVSQSNVSNILGKANANLISMGDGGVVTFTFDNPIADAEGPDFLVFENGFLKQDDSTLAFLELAFVEVSSNGTDFVRFPASSYIPDTAQYDNFTFTNAEQINNLAGKYIMNWGTPFDLAELKGIPNLDISKITHVRIIDVIGILDDNLGSKDKDGRLINDPYPTPYPSCGFDINAIGVLHNADGTQNIPIRNLHLSIYPNPAADFLQIDNNLYPANSYIIIYNTQGQIVYKEQYTGSTVDVRHLISGSYIIRLQNDHYVYQTRFQKL